jgi:hypothetical protein
MVHIHAMADSQVDKSPASGQAVEAIAEWTVLPTSNQRQTTARELRQNTSMRPLLLSALILSQFGTAAPLEIRFTQPPGNPVEFPASNWESQAQPVGNGRIGAMIFGNPHPFCRISADLGGPGRKRLVRP